MDIVMIIGRVLFALIFLASGLNHFTKAKHMVATPSSRRCRRQQRRSTFRDSS